MLLRELQAAFYSDLTQRFLIHEAVSCLDSFDNPLRRQCEWSATQQIRKNQSSIQSQLSAPASNFIAESSHRSLQPMQPRVSTAQESKCQVEPAPLNFRAPPSPEGQQPRSRTQSPDLTIPASTKDAAADQTQSSVTTASARSSTAPDQVPESRSVLGIAQSSSTSSHLALPTDGLPSFGRLHRIPKASGTTSTLHRARAQHKASSNKLPTIPKVLKVSDKSAIHSEPFKRQRKHFRDPGPDNARERLKGSSVDKSKRATTTPHTPNELEDDHHQLSDVTASSATALVPSTESADIPTDSSHRQTSIPPRPETKVKASDRTKVQDLACSPTNNALKKSMGPPQDKVRKTSRALSTSKRVGHDSSDSVPVQRSIPAQPSASASTNHTFKTKPKLGSSSPLPPAPIAQPQPRALPHYTDSGSENDAPVPSSRPHTSKSRSRPVHNYTDSESKVAPARPARRASKTPLSRLGPVHATSGPSRPVPDYTSSEPEDVPVHLGDEASKSKAPMPIIPTRPRPARQALLDYTDSESEDSPIRPTQKPLKAKASAPRLSASRSRLTRQSVLDHTDSESDNLSVDLKPARGRAFKSKSVLHSTPDPDKMQEPKLDGSEEEQGPDDPVNEALTALLNDADGPYDEASIEAPTVVSPGHTDATLVARTAPTPYNPGSPEDPDQHEHEANPSKAKGVRSSAKRRAILDDSDASEIEPTPEAGTKNGKEPGPREGYATRPELPAPPSPAQHASSSEEKLEPVDLYELGIIRDEEDLYFAQLALINPPSAAEEPATTGTEVPQGVDHKGDAWPEQETGCCRAEGIFLIPPMEKAQHVPVQQDDRSDNGSSTTPALSSARGSRADGRRLIANLELQKRDLDIHPDLLCVSQLRTREKALRFAKSAIHDWGLFALEPIARGDMVIEYVGEVVRHQLADEREMAYEISGQYSTYLFRVNDDLVVDATRKGNVARLVNHCCTPNCSARILTVNGRKHIVLFARDWIPSGHEITYDYKLAQPKDEEDASPCLCGSEGCRGYL